MKKDKTVCQIKNPIAYADYSVIEKIEVGIVLSGAEVKAIRSGKANIHGSYAQVLNGELWLVGANISGISLGALHKHNPTRDRKLLCHSKEIADIKHKTEAKGLTAIPIRMYFKNNRIKVEIGIARGKKSYDKRSYEKERSIEKNIRQLYK